MRRLDTSTGSSMLARAPVDARARGTEGERARPRARARRMRRARHHYVASATTDARTVRARATSGWMDARAGRGASEADAASRLTDGRTRRRRRFVR